MQSKLSSFMLAAMASACLACETDGGREDAADAGGHGESARVDASHAAGDAAQDAQVHDAGLDENPPRDADAGALNDGSLSDGAGESHDASAPHDDASEASTPDDTDAGAQGTTSRELPDLSPPVAPGDPGSAAVSIEVRTDQPLHFISSLIYGTNENPQDSGQTLRRAGGNRWTAYNWENNASNAGKDWFFQNDGYLSGSDAPAAAVLDVIREATAVGAAALVTVPIGDYVAADKNGDGDVRDTGPDYLSTRFKLNMADKAGSPTALPDTVDGAVYQDEFVAYVKAHAAQGSRVLFALDNEPDLWSETHVAIHPEKVTYEELWERSERFAAMIKRVWPEAPVTGFVSYGFNGLVSLQDAPDAGGRDFVNWYLDQAKAAEERRGGRLIDYLDLHWYPEAQGEGVRIIAQDNAAAVVAARVQAPRSLWDPSYRESSWIADSLGGPVQLLSRLKQQIADHYPGTELAITEWNYGGGDHISGAIAAADVLGVYGREGVALATYWALGEEAFAYAAIRAYRNYDGAGSHFGDVSIPASTSDVANVTAYASLSSEDPDRVVLVVVNKASSERTVGLRIAHPSTFGSLSVYRLSGTSADIAQQPDQASVATNAFRLSLPALSVNVLVTQP